MKMSDLAKIAGVSKSTVSRALANSELVTEETRTRIKALAKEHGYRMDARARNFRKRETLTIGVLVPMPSNSQGEPPATNPFVLEMLGALADELEKKGHELLFAKHSNRDPSWLREFVETRSVDGVIILGQNIYHDILNEIALDYPNLVVWGARMPEQNYITVGSDNYLGGKLVAEHLLQQGCKQLTFLGNTTCPESMQRFAGFKDTVETLVPDTELNVIDCRENHNDGGYRLVSEYVQANKPMDGLFAASDLLANRAIQALRSCQIKVPSDVRIVGYDNISSSEFMTPALTSINQNCRIAAQKLVDKVFARINGKQAESELIPTALIIRESTGVN
ncbi:LacI family DNA-binding transcriptional regulator [Halioxenophilus aromaticivorans]|uniref:LacI family DNA-binding transcriptional regulator n=1 Tax=Halioxenophilus aromaticivorans TaxID=1306992 RepID=A0AAV3U8I8_9ALTE